MMTTTAGPAFDRLRRMSVLPVKPKKCAAGGRLRGDRNTRLCLGHGVCGCVSAFPPFAIDGNGETERRDTRCARTHTYNHTYTEEGMCDEWTTTGFLFDDQSRTTNGSVKLIPIHGSWIGNHSDASGEDFGKMDIWVASDQNLTQRIINLCNFTRLIHPKFVVFSYH
jgi:hypothetical protein